MMNYGEHLKYQRESANISQPDLAKQIGSSQQNISRWERGEVIPSIDFCVKLADFYNISLDELVGREKETVKLMKIPRKSKIDELFDKLPKDKQLQVIGYIAALLDSSQE